VKKSSAGSGSLSLRERVGVREAASTDLAQSAQFPRRMAQHLPFCTPPPTPGGRGSRKHLHWLLLACLLSLPAHAQAPHRGGELRLLARSAAGTIDPQVNYTAQYWQIFALAYDGLVAFRKVPGDRGNKLVPDLADALPVPGDSLTYAFHLRPGLRFSTGALVRPSDVAASLRRIFKIGSPTADTYYGAIAGAGACLRNPDGCVLDGVTANNEAGTVTIRLDHPDPEFLTRLALPHASVLPANVPQRDLGNAPLPGTGPYVIRSYDPGEGMEIVRNPYFREWSADAQPDGYPDRIRYDFGLEDTAEITAILNGQADWTFDAPPADRLAELGAQHADLVHLNPSFAIWFLPMNTRLAPFDDPRVRRALNMAVDRRAVVKLYGGPRLAQPSCQVLPPGLPGYQPYCPYLLDLPAARRLVAESGTAGQAVTLVTDDSPVARAIGTYLLDVLRDLGFVPRLRSLSANVQFTYIQNTRNQVQVSLTNWYSDYPSASTFLGGVFGCSAFRPGSDASPNISGWCDPAMDRGLEAALADPAGAARLAALDRQVTDAAPAAVLFNPMYVDIVSARVRGYAYHNQFRWLIGRAWVE